MRLVVLAAVLALCSGSVGAQDRWAALSSSNESNAPVVWATTQEAAMRNAAAACRRVSNTCGNKPASTDVMSHTFVTMCCTTPKAGCVVIPNASAAAAERRAREIFANAGYSSCGVTRRVNAGTGR